MAISRWQILPVLLLAFLVGLSAPASADDQDHLPPLAPSPESDWFEIKVRAGPITIGACFNFEEGAKIDYSTQDGVIVWVPAGVDDSLKTGYSGSC